jgi:hypothetical protein
VKRAEELQKRAAVGAAYGDLLAPRDRREADKERAAARWPITGLESDGRGAGGELSLRVHLPDWRDRQLIDTVKKPDVVTATASVERLRQAETAGCLDTALDVADTIKPRNSLERMLSHQLAAAHNAAMRMTGLAVMFCNNAENAGTYREAMPRARELAAESARIAHAAARMMTAFQEGMLALAKVRSGGRQTVVVQHVSVNEGGKAVVAGQVGTTSPRSAKR